MGEKKEERLMPTTVRELKPMGYGGILDQAFELYRQNFILFAGIAGVVFVPLALAQALFFSQIAPSPMGEPSPEAVIGPAILFLALAFFTMFTTGAMTKAVSERYLGRPASIGGSYGYVLRRGFAFVGTLLLGGLLVSAGFFLLCVGAIIFSFWVAFLSQVFVIEGLGGTAAIQRSRQIAGGHWGRIFVLQFLVNLLVQFVAAVPAGIIGVALRNNPMMVQVFSALWQGVSNTLLIPIPTTAMILLYYDIRIRKEAFDLQVLAQSLGAAGDWSTSAAAETAGTCRHCGAALLVGAQFCGHCGAAVAAAWPSETAQELPAPPGGSDSGPPAAPPPSPPGGSGREPPRYRRV